MAKMQLKRLQYSFETKNYIRKQFVYKAGDPVQYLYIVKKGEFLVERVLPKVDTPAAKKMSEMLGQRKRNKDGSLCIQNILSHKLSELRDFPFA